MISKIDRLKEELDKKMPLVFSERAYKRELNLLHEAGKIGVTAKKALYKSAEIISLKWNHAAEYKFMSFHPRNIILMDLLFALQPKYFFSHHSALYFNEITDQRPEEYFLSHEHKGRGSVHSSELVPARIRQAFLKAPRKTEKYFEFQKTKIKLLEKQDLDRIGVERRTHVRQGESNQEIYCTSIERTLIDAVISPQYSGGIKTVINAFSTAKYDIKKMLAVYHKYNPYYPYWQSIGLILRHSTGKNIAKEWLDNFGKPEIDFYLDRNFRDDWAFDSECRVFYPKGIL